MHRLHASSCLRVYLCVCVGVHTHRAYSYGPEQWLVEVDVVLPADMPLKEAHDIGEALQVGAI